MSWLRIEGRMPNHRKVAPLSDAAFRLLITAECWSVEERTDGRIPKAIPATLPKAPKKPRDLTSVIDELTGQGLWHESEDGYQIHDFRKYNPPGRLPPIESRGDLSEKRSAAGQKGAAARWQTDSKPDGKLDSKPDDNLPSDDGKPDGKPDSKDLPLARAGAGAHSDSDSDPDQLDNTNQRPDTSEPAEDLGPGGGDASHSTICPLNIRDKLEAAGEVAELVRHLGASADDVRRCLDDFTAFWTIGKCKGFKRSSWAAKARQWVIDQHGQGKLVGLAQGARNVRSTSVSQPPPSPPVKQWQPPPEPTPDPNPPPPNPVGFRAPRASNG